MDMIRVISLIFCTSQHLRSKGQTDISKMSNKPIHVCMPYKHQANNGHIMKQKSHEHQHGEHGKQHNAIDLVCCNSKKTAAATK